MAFDATKEANAGIIGIEAMEQLKLLAAKHKRTKRGQLEFLIEEAARADKVALPRTSVRAIL